MSNGFSSSTRELLRCVGWEERDHLVWNESLYTFAQHEDHLLHSIAVHAASRAFLGMSADDDGHRNGRWPVDPALAAALRAALAEHSTSSAGGDLAHLLVRAGFEHPEIVARLHPWDGLVFRWREDGLRAADVFAELQAAGIGDDAGADRLATVATWIAQPLTALADWYALVDTLFDIEARIVMAPKTDPGEAQHDKLFRKLLEKSSPPVAVDSVGQIGTSEWIDWVDAAGNVHPSARLDERVRVTYEHGGGSHEFRFAGNGSGLNVAAVAKEVENVLERSGRAERVFQLMQQRLSLPVQLFLVADGARFQAAVDELSLPVLAPGRYES